jgi:uncharacterized protein YceH (UPF0502 family)
MDESLPTLNAAELRVLGSLIEKQVTTPDYYPLSLNALVNACNQLTNRDPVVSFDEATVLRALEGLREKRLATLFHGADSRVAKYRHAVPDVLVLTPPEIAVLCLLLLRGPQTVGELRSRSERLHGFENLADVEATLQQLATRQPQPLVTRLPRQPGTKESRYAHLLGGPTVETIPVSNPSAESASAAPNIGDDRTVAIENEIASVKQEIARLQQQFAEFKKQFE